MVDGDQRERDIAFLDQLLAKGEVTQQEFDYLMPIVMGGAG